MNNNRQHFVLLNLYLSLTVTEYSNLNGIQHSDRNG